MTKLAIASNSRTYYVYLEQLAVLSQIVANHYNNHRIMIITDNKVASLHLSLVLSYLRSEQVNYYIVENAEAAKSLDGVTQITTELLDLGYDRNTLLIALGGGAIGDLAGMVASLYFRGVSYLSIPTTLLACVDSAIGGKTAINYLGTKNVLGTFYPADFVIIDNQLLTSLNEQTYRSAFSEVIKYGLILDADFFMWVENNLAKLLVREPIATTWMLERCITLKQEVVELDEYDTGFRALLNFGHTLGHAIEKCYGYGNILHGEAVSIGIHFASLLSQQMGLISHYTLSRIVAILSECGLPYLLKSEISIENLLLAMQSDKKNYQKQIKMVLLTKIGKGVLPRVISQQAMRQTLLLMQEKK